ncbi:Conserved_hypothetical protein [Hexamita inflata]|uniref:Myb-like DNA-binding domain-containing protein n=1 Tax=Hexamita inflata TaxID=28002 RepID=A0AA86QYJ4_9EUKA|nr:Conserved hypothetical protein [Hexamita inflata]
MSRSNYKKQEWTDADRDKLINLTESYRINKQQINWPKIASQMNNRTDTQCKSYYANIIKPKLDIEIRENHAWSRREIFSLWVLGVNYNADFNIVKSTVHQLYQDLTIKQLQSQWHQIITKQRSYYKLFKTILQNPIHIQTLSKKQFVNSSLIVRVTFNRKLLIDLKLFQNQTDLINDNGRPVDLMEIKAIERFFLDLDVNGLREIYIKEHERRGIEDKHENF